VLAVYSANTPQVARVRGRFFDPVSGTWQPETGIDPNNTAAFGGSVLPVALLDGIGNALAVFDLTELGSGALGSNYFARNVGSWGQLAPGETVLGTAVPGSIGGRVAENLQLAASTDGNFLLAWDHIKQDDPLESAEIRIAHFTSRTRTWSEARTLVQGGGQNTQFPMIQLQRVGSDASGNALVLWTQIDGERSAALKAVRLDHAAAACTVVLTIDRAVGGAAARADLAVEPQGNAIAIWQQFEGSRPDDGSRSNIAINRFDGATGTWASAVLAETQPGDAISPRASANGGQALLGWIQSDGGVNRVKALLQPLANTLSLN
jgi:hypothetical protein